MKQEIGKLGKHTLIYGIGIIAGKAASFIMLPVYTRYLTPADYGLLELLLTTVDVISMIAGIGLTSTVFKFYYEYESPEDRKEVISTVVMMSIGLAFITAILGMIGSPEISRLIFGRSDHAGYFRLLFIIYFLQSGIVNIPMMFIRAMQNSKLFVLMNLTKLAIQVSLNIYFIVVLQIGVPGVLYSALLAEFSLGLYLALYTFRHVGFRFSTEKSRKILRFGYPFVISYLSSFVLTYSDRYFLNTFGNLEMVGIYALAYKFGFILTTLAFTPFNMIWEAQRFEIAKQENALPIFKKVFLYSNLLLVSLSLLISLFVRDFLRVMSDPAFWAAYKIVPIVLIAYIIQSWTAYCNLGIYLAGRSQYLAVSSGVAALVVIGLNFLLIPTYGGYGAAWATVGAFGVKFLLVYIFSQRFYLVDYGWNRPLLLLVLSNSFYLIGQMLEMASLPASMAVNAGLMLLFVIVAYTLFLEKQEKTALKLVVKNLGLRKAVSM